MPAHTNLTAEQLRQLRKVFDVIDKDGTGTISAEEFADAMESLGLKPTDAEAKDIIEDIDLNKDGQIDFHEFLRVMAHPETNRALRDDPEQQRDAKKEQRELLAAFRVFDRDGSGSISPEELRHALRSLGDNYTDEEISDMIAHADLDGNGSIDYQEFVELMSQKQ